MTEKNTLPCLVDLCIFPVGTDSVSGSDFVTKIEQQIQESGLSSTLHGMGTTIEGPWDDVMYLIGQLHLKAHQNGYVRIHSDIRVGTRTDKPQSYASKVQTVERKLKELSK
ncbi:hypothetical protein TBLA_0A00180 [Henningerozyma blattae CBS 6284]|uniref:Thiamine-binding protein domain-containing protein n=1 Tax=Henningerozyma blattae (strain ATCC 34711 / CBS 6284 / DSM 70876 / NBRC 10599 / NRRL Y-10934 / UCD 77-7) TaxID=1071380 RepID=I2GUL8_HENB6|nr:hypothetical protein TBLA_0A00180 [Tetrapisispora blattae CBS 6284]CCH57820.1 hypothetical protein TBLA_0A00180 [Tetrapisispora blattae CBS 6284]